MYYIKEKEVWLVVRTKKMEKSALTRTNNNEYYTLKVIYMTVVVEVCIFLALVLGIIILTFTIFNKDDCIKSSYVREKQNGEKVLVEIKYIGLNDEDIQEISQIIATGEFDNIYDIADEFKAYKKDE